MTLTPSPTTENEFLLEGGDLRERLLAVALGARVVRNRCPSRMFLTREASIQWRALVDGGYWPVRRNGQLGFVRDPKPVPLLVAVNRGRGKE
jgi:hypothetical protein